MGVAPTTDAATAAAASPTGAAAALSVIDTGLAILAGAATPDGRPRRGRKRRHPKPPPALSGDVAALEALTARLAGVIDQQAALRGALTAEVDRLQGELWVLRREGAERRGEGGRPPGVPKREGGGGPAGEGG